MILEEKQRKQHHKNKRRAKGKPCAFLVVVTEVKLDD